MPEGAVKPAANRIRKRFRALLEAEIARTVKDPSEVDQEIRELLRP